METVGLVVGIIVGITVIGSTVFKGVGWLTSRSKGSPQNQRSGGDSSVTIEGDVHAPVTTGGAAGASEYGPGIGVARDVTINQGLNSGDKEQLNRIEDTMKLLLDELALRIATPSTPQSDTAALAAAQASGAITGILDELARGMTGPGTPQPDTDELAAQATGVIERRLEGALKLFRAGEYREAIERVLSAYDRDLPPGASAQLHLVAGNAYFSLSDYGAAEMHFSEALRAAPNASAKAAATGNLGLVYAERGDLEGSEKYHRKALDVHEEVGYRLGQANQLGNLGNVYVSRGDLDGAEEHYRKAVDMFKEIGYRLGQANQLMNLGVVYWKRGDLDGAEEHYRKALDIFREAGYRLGQARSFGNLGLAYAGRGDLERAEEYHRKALDIHEEIGSRLGQARQLSNLGIVYAGRGDLEGAEKHHRSALKIAEEIGATPLVGEIRDLLEDLKEKQSD